ncbi:MAG: hypothetical protein NVSMB57_17210 [Actinomycetota bacterium]
MMLGDDRERRRRAGLENLPAIAGFAAAIISRADEATTEAARLRPWTTQLREQIPALIPDVQMHGDPATSLPGIVAFSILYVEGETLLLMLDAKGIGVHSGSSCVSSAQEPSHVLSAMGALTHGSVRVSLGRTTTQHDIDRFLDALPPIVKTLRSTMGIGEVQQ